jgi:hypothetical protein
MLMTWQILVLLILVKVLIGSVIGVAETGILYRSQSTPRAFLRGIVLGVLGWLTGAFLAGWGDAHSYFFNGKRMDQAPWGENLWLRNRLAENEILLSLLLASIAIFIGFKLARRPSIDRDESAKLH